MRSAKDHHTPLFSLPVLQGGAVAFAGALSWVYKT